MDFLNKSLAQLKDLFEGMTPGSRIVAGLLLVVVVVSLVYLFTVGISGPEVFLLDNRAFSSDELTAMEAAFGKAGLDSYEIVAGRIRVPRGQRAAYTAALAEGNALPQDFGDIFAGALNSGSPFEGKHRHEARLRIAKQRELANIISSMKGIQKAAVFYDTETKPGFRKDKLTTATISVAPKGSKELDEELASTIRQTAMGAIAGLKPENVFVTDLNTGRTFRGNPEGLDGGAGGSYAEKKHKYEQQWKTKIAGLLSYVPGVIVTANVELSKEQRHRELEIKYDPKGTVSQRMETTSSRTTDGADQGGRPGYAAQGNMPRTLATTTKGSHDEEEQSEMSESVRVPGTENEKIYAPLTPERVTVSIAVPASYLAKVWHERNPTKPGEDPKDPPAGDLDKIRIEEETNIKGTVALQLPPVAGVDDTTDLVQVSVFQDITPEAIPEPEMGEKALTWLGQYWSTLGMIGLAFFSLLMLRSMVRATPQGQPIARAGASEGGLEEGEPKKEDMAARLWRFGTTGASLKDELSELVAEDPDTAAKILNNWIGNVTNTP